METNRPVVPSCSPSHANRGSDTWEASSDDDNGTRPANSGSIDTSLRHSPKQNCQSQAAASNTAPTFSTVPATTPSPVKYTLAYVYKAEMANFFTSLFIERLQGTPAWGIDRTTSCIRVHALEDAVEFEIDWGHPTAPSARDVFQQEAWGEVAMKEVTQLTIRVPFNKGQDVIQRLCYPSIVTQ
ncbi:uncharacterized protein LY79DRAFT_258395 [Colletotrichum navitas]|uniref:Uncharacterized protein n=1 Tax=Colletotrichum navitas TaxID=681940 RepID=A0AAD8PWC1_9PEZI|nr:uncharacterized protein LY79DRAFT_258395 [Colletotrichum navitas]KAK1585890.1 hypothetical protein LY79DRAFT_258395 [Colletotrichum navitas]